MKNLKRNILAIVTSFVTSVAMGQNEATINNRISKVSSESELPGAPANASAKLVIGNDGKSLRLNYNGNTIFEAVFTKKIAATSVVNGNEAVEQRIKINTTSPTGFRALVHGSHGAIAAETRGQSQKNFPLVRTTHGISYNRRNNSVYDRDFDWMLEAPEGTVIVPVKENNGNAHFEIKFETKQVELIFRPRYYQKHKNLAYFKPWTYQVYKEPVTGWSSWWAYMRKFSEKDLTSLLDIWQKKHFADYGYRFIQMDDVFQGENDKGRANSEKANGYFGGRPTTWLDWKKNLFPGGLTNYVEAVKKAGFEPAIWMGAYFSDKETVEKNPDWFVTDKLGKPVAAPWVSYTMDATNPEAVAALIRPVFRAMKNAGMEYIKIDILRHLLYDCLNNNLEWCARKGVSPAEVLRTYLQIAREEVGDDTFLLACWGVRPELIGLADACRIGGDGYGPVTMQQYNSWNGIVWRNDPDHCDVLPQKAALGQGNVTQTSEINSTNKESIIRPALASIAGAMLILSDKPDVYTNDENLYGLRRSSPVLFSVPGQLYDFDPVKSDWLKTHQLTEIKSGADPSPIDADQFGEVCAYWLNEFNCPFENWNVFHRLNWDKKEKLPLKPVTIKMTDLGLNPANEYLLYEFWSNKMLGVVKNEFKLGELPVNGIESIAIREVTGRPQLISTNRHISQGAAEIEMMRWEDNSIKGRSRAIVDDAYVITLYVPNGYTFLTAKINGKEAEAKQTGNILKITYLPKETASVEWEINFKH